MKRISIILTIVLLLGLALAACGGDDETSSNDTGADNATEAQPESTQSTEGVSEVASVEPITFEITGNPDITQTVTTDQWVVQQFDTYFYLLLQSQSQDVSVTLSNIPNDVAPGDYQLTTGSPDSTSPTASLQLGLDPETVYYDSEVDGTLTISEVADSTISGSFDFTASTSVAEGEQPATAHVVGSFSELALP